MFLVSKSAMQNQKLYRFTRVIAVVTLLWALGTDSAASSGEPDQDELESLMRQHHHIKGESPSAELAIRIAMQTMDSELSSDQIASCKTWSPNFHPDTIQDVFGRLFFGQTSGSDGFFGYSCRAIDQTKGAGWDCILARFSDKNGEHRTHTVHLQFDHQTLAFRKESLRCGT